MPDWKETEKQIQEEMVFLKDNVFPAPYTHDDKISCHDCLFRLIATLIVTGKISARKINTAPGKIWRASDGLDLYGLKKHGANWHDSTIKIIDSYFKGSGHATIREPSLLIGRADLGVESLGLFFEVGTISLYKLYYNLAYMNDAKIILIPEENYLIEFIV